MSERVWPLNLLEKVALENAPVEVRMKDGFIIRGRLLRFGRFWSYMLLGEPDNFDADWVWVNGHYVLMVRLLSPTYVGGE